MVEGLFCYRKSRRLAEIEIEGHGAKLDFLKPGTICFLREAENENRRTAYDLFSVYDGSTLVCIDAKEPLHIAKTWYTERLFKELAQDDISLYENTRDMILLGFHGIPLSFTIQVMGTSLVKDGTAFLPEIPSSALNRRLDEILWAKEHGGDPRLLFVVCRDDAEAFAADEVADPLFADLLSIIIDEGIMTECLRCSVSENGLTPDRMIPIRI